MQKHKMSHLGFSSEPARRCVLFVSLVGLWASHGCSEPKCWPQFRGPEGAGIAVATEPDESIPTQFGPDTNVVWKTALPPGVSSPCIWGDRIFVTGYTEDGHALALIALDRDTGKIIWERHPESESIEKVHDISSPAASTPVTDGKRVYCMFGSIGLVCFDYSGDELWRLKLGPFETLFGWGEASSPILHGDAVIQICDNDQSSSILSVNKHTGDINWRTPRPLASNSYASPALWTVDGQTRIAVAGSGRLDLYNADTGEHMAHVNGLTRFVNTTPVLSEGMLYVAAYSPNSSNNDDRVVKALLSIRDTNQDEALSEEELPHAIRRSFAPSDTDGDGRLDYDEIIKLMENERKGFANEVMMAVKPGGTGDLTDSHVAWSVDEGSPYVPSPLLINGRMYVVKDGGMVSCLDSRTGERLYDRERLDARGPYYASPVYAPEAGSNGILIFISREGIAGVLREGPKFEVLARNDMEEICMATPAILEGRLYLRTEEHMYCFASPQLAK